MNEMVLLSQTDDESVEQKAKYIDDLLSEEEIVKKAEEIQIFLETEIDSLLGDDPYASLISPFVPTERAYCGLTRRQQEELNTKWSNIIKEEQIFSENKSNTL